MSSSRPSRLSVALNLARRRKDAKCGQIKPQAGAQLIRLKVHSCCQSMFDHLRIAGKRALIALAAISAIWVFFISSSGAEFNGTTYHLGEKEAVVTLPVSASHLNLTLSYKTQNMTLFDEDGKNVSFNSSYRFWRGEHIYSLTWERNITGKLVYTMPVQGQQFILPLRDERPVAIILPAGYTTGERSLGIARPAPDEFVEDNAGSILIWNNTTQISYIDLTYYRKSAPQALMIILAILALTGLVLIGQYYTSIRKLRAARMEVENEMQKKRN